MIRARLAAVVVVSVAALSMTGVAARRWSKTGSGAAGMPTAIVTRGVFVDFLQLRGEIRPVRSVVLTAPSSGTDLQIVEIVKNGATVSAGDVVAEFDPTVLQRTRETKASELKQAESEIAHADAELQRRVQSAQSELGEARQAVQRARLDVQGNELRPRIEAENLVLTLSNAEAHVRELEQKVEGERIAAAADVAIARQKRDKALYDVRETDRILSSLAIRAPASGTVSLLPNFRAGSPFSRAAPEFKRGDRAWFGAAIAELPDLSAMQMTARVDEFDRGRLQARSAVHVRVDAVPDRDLAGTLQEISVVAKPDFSTWPPVRNFDLVIALTESDARLRSGMSGAARIELDRQANVLV
ncbi:MAG TPA: HlyD family efflux transporter periplasmic adaptor subunit, partial [Vicinamibacterales bacterium]|nr:HlyD family efflux transporter periplasmic adaptor subunit [Vicinamibacterales bacterium]